MLVIPLGPEDREVRRWPWVTIGIVALNVLVFVLAGPSERSAGDPQGLAAQWGFIPGEPSPWRAVTAAFVHANLWHLAGNMIFLLATGPFLEDAYGRVLFPVIYLASAISGCYAWGELGGGRFVRAVGASGPADNAVQRAAARLTELRLTAQGEIRGPATVEIAGDLAEAQTERAESFDVTSDPLVGRRLRLGQRERQRDLGRGSNSFRPCPPSRGDPQTGLPSAFSQICEVRVYLDTVYRSTVYRGGWRSGALPVSSWRGSFDRADSVRA